MTRHQKPSLTAQLDVLSNTLLGFIFLFVATFLLISKAFEEIEKSITTSGEYVAVVIWDDKSEDDVDTHMRDPMGNHLYFSAREVGLMHLERDDRGRFNDQTAPDGSANPIGVDKNEERAIIRGIVPGEYIVNIHMFRKADAAPTKVKIVLIRLRGEDTAVTERELIFERQGEEKTAFRFTLKVDGSVTDVNQLPRKFIGGSDVPDIPENQQSPQGGD